MNLLVEKVVNTWGSAQRNSFKQAMYYIVMIHAGFIRHLFAVTMHDDNSSVSTGINDVGFKMEYTFQLCSPCTGSHAPTLSLAMIFIL